MLTLAVKALLGMASVNAWSQPNQPGAGVSLTKVGANNAKDVLAPYIFDLLKDIQIPKVSFSGGSLDDLIIHLPCPPLEDIGMNFEHSTNGVELIASGVQATISSDFTYTYWITVSGQAAIKINKANVDFEVDISEQQVGSEKAPLLKVQKSVIQVNPANVDITLTGGLASKIAGAFIPYLKSTVVPDVIKIIQKTVTETINIDINRDIYQYGTKVAIKEVGWVTADYSQMATNAQVTDKSTFEMAVNGTFYNSNKTAASVYPAPVAWPVRNPSGRSLQGHLTEWTVNTALEAGFSTDNTLDVTTILHQLLGLNVTTSDLGTVVPQLITKYGANKTINLSGRLINQKSVAHATTGHAEITLNLAITGTVGSSEAFYGEFNAGQAVADIHTNSTGGIFGELSTLSIGTITPGTFRTALPGVTAASMQAQLQLLVTGVQTKANAALAVGTQIHSLFGITGAIEVHLHNGFVELGVDATPVAFEGIRDIMNNLADRVRYFKKTEQMNQINLQF